MARRVPSRREQLGEEDAPHGRTISTRELAEHSSKTSAWVSYNGDVYDVTNFLAAHPGGSQVIEPYLGTDVGFAMTEEHRHTEAAFKLLGRYRIGSLEGEGRAQSMSRGRTAFLEGLVDPEKPIMVQVWNLKANYYDWINAAELFNEPLRCFKSPVLEVFSRTPWYVVPLVWLPVSVPELYVAFQTLSLVAAACAWFCGMMAWGMLEYLFHRFLFHGSLRRSDSKM